jgi:hypothetical protein
MFFKKSLPKLIKQFKPSIAIIGFSIVRQNQMAIGLNGTAFCVAPSLLATAAHVYQQIQEEEKKRFVRWFWLVIPLLIIILAIIFWPSRKVSEKEIKEPVISEKVEKDIQIPSEETEQPETKPVIEEIKYEMPGGQHTVKPGEKLWTISLDFYNQGDLWPNIYRMNLNETRNPDLLLIGNEISIPSLQGKPGNLTQNDIEDIAEGFIEVYLAYKESDNRKALYYLWVVKKWNINEIIDKYSDRIDETDLKLVDKIEGYPQIK